MDSASNAEYTCSPELMRWSSRDHPAFNSK